MRKTMKKMLAASTVCIIMSGSFIGRSARILAEQYYGWNDGKSDMGSVFRLYVSPTNDTTRKLLYQVFCFNKEFVWPENWEEGKTFDQVQADKPYDLKLYNRVADNAVDNQLSQKVSKKEHSNKLGNILRKLFELADKEIESTDLRKTLVVQCAIWYFTDNQQDPKSYLSGISLTEKETTFFNKLVDEGKKAKELSSTNSDSEYQLALYLSDGSKNYADKEYQHLIGFSKIDKPKPEPQPEPMPKPEPKPEPMPKPEPKPEPMPKPE
ncbi:TPA: thioester-forming surface-anchored protein, partial [Streptococcus equi subsp. zooepidemicus]|nr:thioester-forming surface-anchored protein [Streptococcus equi subsp. zooepidemicus]